jgi:hypothetical protein
MTTDQSTRYAMRVDKLTAAYHLVLTLDGNNTLSAALKHTDRGCRSVKMTSPRW